MKIEIDIKDFIDIDAVSVADDFIKNHSIEAFDEYMSALQRLKSELHDRIYDIKKVAAVMDDEKIDYDREQLKEKLDYLNNPLKNIEDVYKRLADFKYNETWLYYVKTNCTYDNLVMKTSDELEEFIKTEPFVALEGYRAKVEAWLNGIKNDKIALESGVKMVGRFGYNIRDIDSYMMKKKADLYIETATKYYNKLLHGIEERQNKCHHEWVEFGHDSHYTYFRCSICGKEVRE